MKQIRPILTPSVPSSVPSSAPPPPAPNSALVYLAPTLNPGALDGIGYISVARCSASAAGSVISASTRFGKLTSTAELSFSAHGETSQKARNNPSPPSVPPSIYRARSSPLAAWPKGQQSSPPSVPARVRPGSRAPGLERRSSRSFAGSAGIASIGPVSFRGCILRRRCRRSRHSRRSRRRPLSRPRIPLRLRLRYHRRWWCPHGPHGPPGPPGPPGPHGPSGGPRLSLSPGLALCPPVCLSVVPPQKREDVGVQQRRGGRRG